MVLFVKGWFWVSVIEVKVLRWPVRVCMFVEEMTHVLLCSALPCESLNITCSSRYQHVRSLSLSHSHPLSFFWPLWSLSMSLTYSLLTFPHSFLWSPCLSCFVRFLSLSFFFICIYIIVYTFKPYIYYIYLIEIEGWNDWWIDRLTQTNVSNLNVFLYMNKM